MTKRKKKHKEDNCPMSQFQKMYKALGTDKEAVMEMVEKDLKTTALRLITTKHRCREVVGR